MRIHTANKLKIFQFDHFLFQCLFIFWLRCAPIHTDGSHHTSQTRREPGGGSEWLLPVSGSSGVSGGFVGAGGCCNVDPMTDGPRKAGADCSAEKIIAIIYQCSPTFEAEENQKTVWRVKWIKVILFWEAPTRIPLGLIGCLNVLLKLSKQRKQHWSVHCVPPTRLAEHYKKLKSAQKGCQSEITFFP